MGLIGLSQINIELNSTCHKKTKCGMCGHQKASVHPNREDGEISWILLQRIRKQLPDGLLVQFHKDGDPLDSSQLVHALDLYDGCIRNIVTHGERLHERANELHNRCETVTVSLFHGDPDLYMQLDSIRGFMNRAEAGLPRVLVKWVGQTDANVMYELDRLGIQQIYRLIHIPNGNMRYAKNLPTVPEVGICLDALHHPSVDWKGNVYLCNRLDPKGQLRIGNLYHQTLDDVWNGPLRQEMVQAHIEGRRGDANPVCQACQYWGVPSG